MLTCGTCKASRSILDLRPRLGSHSAHLRRCEPLGTAGGTSQRQSSLVPPEQACFVWKQHRDSSSTPRWLQQQIEAAVCVHCHPEVPVPRQGQVPGLRSCPVLSPDRQRHLSPHLPAIVPCCLSLPFTQRVTASSTASLPSSLHSAASRNTSHRFPPHQIAQTGSKNDSCAKVQFLPDLPSFAATLGGVLSM